MTWKSDFAADWRPSKLQRRTQMGSVLATSVLWRLDTCGGEQPARRELSLLDACIECFKCRGLSRSRVQEDEGTGDHWLQHGLRLAGNNDRWMGQISDDMIDKSSD